MERTDTLSRIIRTGIVPVVRASSSEEALAVTGAILRSGIDVIEVTMTVPGALDVIRELAGRYRDELVLGAGTVLDSETARACMMAGARFIASPILDEATIACCRTDGVPVMAGALTPTEVVRAWQAGAALVKVFPCSAVGGASYVRALKAPLPQIDLIPTGGVSATTVAEFIAAGAAAVGAGADLVDVKKIRAGESSAVTENGRRYLQEIARARKGAPA
jgi:2-dehydro-3-deoxyphosphogluconate aldolase/(4S)-4-hydroxy-2-oxoglutarate aldolase